MEPTYISLIPPVVVLFIALFSQNTIFAISSGILASSLIISNFSIFESIKLIFSRMFQTSQVDLIFSEKIFSCDKFFLLSFILILSITISLLIKVKIEDQFSKALENFSKTKESAKKASIGLSLSLFIDDYLSAMTVSKIMPKILDKFKISRLESSFLVTAFAAPLCTIVPISSWGAAISTLMASSGISDEKNSLIFKDSFLTLVKSVPFIFFSIALIGFTIFKVFLKKESSKKESGKIEYKNLALFLFPIFTIVFSIISSLLFMGENIIFMGQNGFLKSIQQAPSEISLFFGICFAFFIIFSTFLYLKKVKLSDFFSICINGFFEIKDVLILLFLAWTFSSFLINDLKTGEFIAGKIIQNIQIKFLPAAIFMLASVISFTIGSSWATMSILFPTVIPILALIIKQNLASSEIILHSTIGAILSGVIFGSSLAPTSDLLIMTSKNTGIKIDQYVKMQAKKLFPIGAVSLFLYILTGIFS